MITAIALGTLGFWVFVVLLVAALTALVESEAGMLATVVFIGALAFINRVYNLGLVAFVQLNPWTTALYVGYYLAAGIAWSFIKWYFFLHKTSVQYEVLRATFLANKNATEMTPALAAEFSTYSYNTQISSVNAADHKADLIRWATYWPFSIVGFALNDLVRKTWEYIYELLSSSYQRMADAILKDVRKDEELAKQHAASQSRGYGAK